MSGAGRKHRAKHLTRQYLDVNAWDDLCDGECFGICVEPPSGGHVRTLLIESKMAEDGTITISEPREQLVLLPGKFNKVMWLRIRDVLVVHDNSVVLKPSPEQLANFLKAAGHDTFAQAIENAQKMAESMRRDVERMPQYSNTAVTTTSVLPVDGISSAHAAEGQQQDDLFAEDTDELDNFVNPNRKNIKHRQQFFFGVEDEEDEDEEEDG